MGNYSMNHKPKVISAGDEIDSKCTRCKEETIHRVVAMVAGEVHLVICTRCWGQHRYRPSHKDKVKRVPQITKRQNKGNGKAKKIQISPPMNGLQEWQILRSDAGNLRPLPYDQYASYQVSQAIDHSIFGLGFVRKVIASTKMEVIFQREIKLLVMNRVIPVQS